MKKMTKYFIILIGIFFLIRFTACHHSADTREKTMTVTSQSVTTTLYYSGMVQPYHVRTVTSPTDGIIEAMHFNFGEAVQSGQLLFTLASQKFHSDYKAALTQYIKAKADFNTSQSQLDQGNFLHKNQLISDDELKTKRAAFYNAQLTFLQAKDVLTELLKQLKEKNNKFYQLSIADIDKITEALHLNADAEKLQLTAPTVGVALLPEKNDSQDGAVKKISVGDSVKQGDTLAVIGDADGLTIRINVNEFNVNQLKIQQPVKITGVAFADVTLVGVIQSIERQGQLSSSGVPVFPVEIVVPHLTAEQQKIIHVGMSAKVEIDIHSAPEILVPLPTIFQKNGQQYVRVKNEKTGHITERSVKAGQTTPEGVIILSNLAVGEKLVIPN